MAKQVVQMWVETIRPKTLPVAAASIMTGGALAFWSGGFDGCVAIFCLLTTLLLQILSNIANDYGDYQHGSDTKARLGPLRGIQKGEMTAQQLKKALSWLVLACLISGAFLIGISYQSLQDMLVFVLFGLLAIVAAVAYTVGSKPYGYLGLGDASVFVFFGLLGVGGSYYLQTHRLEPLVLLPAFATGFLAVAVLNINNLRDIEQDEQAGKYTLAVRLGAFKARQYHLFLLFGAVMSYVVFAILAANSLTNGFCYLLVGLGCPWLWRHGRFVYKSQKPSDLPPMLADMVGLLFIMNLLFALGLVLATCFA